MNIPGRKGYTDETLAQSFWERVEIGKDSECWPWTAAKHSAGYGKFKRNGKYYLAHRYAFEWQYGATLPSRVLVCHVCDNPKCCNPNHFFLGENDDNIKDAARKGILSHGAEQWNAKLDDESVRKIRVSHFIKGLTQQFIASEFGVSRRAIGLIISGKSWKHVI